MERDQARRERDEAEDELAKVLVSHDQTYASFQRTSAVMSEFLKDVKVLIALEGDGDDDEDLDISIGDAEEAEEE